MSQSRLLATVAVAIAATLIGHRPPRHLLTVIFVIVIVAAVGTAAPDQAELVGAIDDRGAQLATASVERTRHSVRYDGRYLAIAYPGGDVPENTGVCTDVVIRSYRAIGIDLQVLVHEDMANAFSAYPNHWGLSHPDRNIDHRRVPNLRRFLERHGASRGLSDDPKDFRAGDIVTWMLPGNLPHIGIVSDHPSAEEQRPLVVHNVGSGPRLEDVLFEYEMTGHYRYLPEPADSLDEHD